MLRVNIALFVLFVSVWVCAGILVLGGCAPAGEHGQEAMTRSDHADVHGRPAAADDPGAPSQECPDVAMVWVHHLALDLPAFIFGPLQALTDFPVAIVGNCEEGACVVRFRGVSVREIQDTLDATGAEAFGRSWVVCGADPEGLYVELIQAPGYDVRQPGVRVASRYADWVQAWLALAEDTHSGKRVFGQYIWEYVPDVGAGGQGNILEPGEPYEDEQRPEEEA